jgi:hypothetical protein
MGWKTGVLFLVGEDTFSPPKRPDRLWGSPILLSNGYRRLFPGVKRQVHETDHSISSIADVKNNGAIPPHPICLHGVVLNYTYAIRSLRF